MFLALHRAVAVRMHLLRTGGQALGGPARTGSQQDHSEEVGWSIRNRMSFTAFRSRKCGTKPSNR